MTKKVRKAVFPVAGFGTRFLPATKSMPKELMPVVDRPLIQYAAEEAVRAGIDTLIFVTGRHKRAIEDHFDSNPELENALRAKGRHAEAEMVKNILPEGVECASPSSSGSVTRCSAPRGWWEASPSRSCWPTSLTCSAARARAGKFSCRTR